jgi:excisionase family DNA binding protein
MNALITTGQAARELGVSAATLTRWAASGKAVPAQRTAGGHYRWKLADLRRQVRGIPEDPRLVLAENIAAVIHDANRRLQVIEGDEVPSPLWDDAPQRQIDGAVASVLLALDEPGRTPEENHQGWMDRLAADGWAYGPVKSEQDRTHPLLLSWEQLPEEARRKDRLFIAIVRALAPRGDRPPEPGQ